MRARWPRIASADYAVAFLCGVGVALLWFGVAKAAERDPTILWAIVACMKQPEERGCYELAAYESRAECGVMLARVAVKVSGARLTCQQIDRVRR